MRVNGNYYQLPTNRNSSLCKAGNSKNVTFNGINWANPKTIEEIGGLIFNEKKNAIVKSLLMTEGCLAIVIKLLSSLPKTDETALYALALFGTFSVGKINSYYMKEILLNNAHEALKNKNISLGEFAEIFKKTTGQELKNIHRLNYIR